jgi:hypothetical protein
MFKVFKQFAAVVIALGLFASQALPAFACGALVAPNGAIRLSRAATLVAWHDGIERYMTSFTYQGDFSKLGWIVPLPAVPMKIEEGGAWTLQRLFRETHPEPVRFVNDTAVQSATAGVEVLQQVKVEALNITVVRGSGQAVLDWATHNGFFLNNETRAHLLGYAKGSPIFMAAKYDLAAARARHQIQGDGAPVLITMKTPHLWVPLEVLAMEGQQVQADLYLLTDEPVNTGDFSAKIGQPAVGTDVPGAPGLKVAFQEQMNSILYRDLSTDRNMGWVRSNSWLTYLSLDAPETAVTYDLGISPTGVIRLAPYGTPPMAVVDGQESHELPGWLPGLPMGTPRVALILAFLLGIACTVLLILRARVRPRSKAS